MQFCRKILTSKKASKISDELNCSISRPVLASCEEKIQKFDEKNLFFAPQSRDFRKKSLFLPLFLPSKFDRYAMHFGLLDTFQRVFIESREKIKRIHLAVKNFSNSKFSTSLRNYNWKTEISNYCKFIKIHCYIQKRQKKVGQRWGSISKSHVAMEYGPIPRFQLQISIIFTIFSLI